MLEATKLLAAVCLVPPDGSVFMLNVFSMPVTKLQALPFTITEKIECVLWGC